MTKKESLYLKAKEQYYLGTPIMEDWEFDELEADLKKINSPVITIVGFADRNLKFPHPSPMLSLSKYQADKNTGEAPVDEANAWLNDHILMGENRFLGSPKYDGNAINIIYRNTKLHMILSRGEGVKGRDYTPKLYRHVPPTISEKGTVEVRAEVVIRKDVFAKKYASSSANERNFVAGVLNRKEDDPSIIKGEVLNDLVVICHEGKSLKDGISYLSSEKLTQLGFNSDYELHEIEFKSTEFLKTYEYFKNYRENVSPFLLDGLVIKTLAHVRPILGENSHDPNWAVAIKFPPLGATTKVESISWKMGKTGSYTPVVNMTPVHLDGTTVKRASAYNCGYVISSKVYPGAVVKIAKAGDIIPQIIEVIKPGKRTHGIIPTHCEHCGQQLKLKNDTHLLCPDKDCKGRRWEFFVQGIRRLKMFGVSGSVAESLWNMGLKMSYEVLNKNKVNEKTLIGSGYFQKGRTLEKFLTERDKITELSLDMVILLCGFDKVGNSVSKQVAKMLSGMDYDFSGLDRNAANGFKKGEEKFEILKTAMEEIEKFVSIKKPRVSKGTIKFEMTGSPKSFGFKTKADFVNAMTAKGWSHAKLNEADYLVTDNPTGKSGKMKQAIKKSIKIVNYSDALNI